MPKILKRSTLCSTFFLILFLFPGLACAYSYALKEAPIDKIFQEGLGAAKEGDWALVMQKAKQGIALQKNHFFKGDSLLPEFNASIANKDISKTAENFAALVYLSIKEKFYQNKMENLKNIANSKNRLILSQQSYLNVLDGNVKKQELARSKRILESFKKAFASIGNPGIFGFGKREPSLREYEAATKTIDTLLLKTFPGFSKY